MLILIMLVKYCGTTVKCGYNLSSRHLFFCAFQLEEVH